MEITLNKLDQFIREQYQEQTRDRPTIHAVMLRMVQQVVGSTRDSLMSVAVMVQGAIRWTEIYDGAWWYKTKTSWHSEYAINRQTVDRGNEVLRKLGWCVETRTVNSNLIATHYRLNEPEKFFEWLAKTCGCAVELVRNFFQPVTAEPDETDETSAENEQSQLPQPDTPIAETTHSDCEKFAHRLREIRNNIINNTSFKHILQRSSQQTTQDADVDVDQSSDEDEIQLKKQMLQDAGVSENRLEQFSQYPIDRVQAVTEAAAGKYNPGGWIVSALMFGWEVAPETVKVPRRSAGSADSGYVPGQYDSFVNT